MSRVELDSIQSQLRLAIKSHQALVARMKADPQNTMLQNQLHGLQTSITTLSERQKLIVQQLRKELIPIQPRLTTGQPQQVTQVQLATTGAAVQIPTAQVQLATTAAAVQIPAAQVQLATSQAVQLGSQVQPVSTQLQLATSQLQLATAQLPAGVSQIQLTTQAQSTFTQLQPTIAQLQSVASQLQPGTAQLHTVAVSQFQPVAQLQHVQLHPVQLQSQTGIQLAPQAQLQVTPAQVQLVGAQLQGTGFQLAPVTQVMLTQQNPIVAPQVQGVSPGAGSSEAPASTTPSQQPSPAKPSATALSPALSRTNVAPRPIAPRVTIPTVLRPPTPGSASMTIVRPAKGNQKESQKATAVNRAKVPTPAPRSGSPLIRVPHYQSKPAGSHHKPTILNKPSGSGLAASVPVVHRQSSHERKTAPERVKVIPEEKRKSEYMAALDLVSRDTLKELQNKRSERKRRSTANPQFAYSNFEERRHFHYLSPVLGVGGKKPRVNKARNGSAGPSTPTKAPSPSENGVANQGVSPDCCVVCHKSGELLMCDACMSVYHMPCVDPPVLTVPSSTWICPKCQALGKQATNWPGTLALVTSYIAQKTAKEEEKKRLEKKSQELKGEQGQLENKTKQLNEQINNQLQKKKEITQQNRALQQDVDKLRNFIKVFQT